MKRSGMPIRYRKRLFSNLCAPFRFSLLRGEVLQASNTKKDQQVAIAIFCLVFIVIEIS